MNIKLEDKELESIYYLKDIRYNLISINPKIFFKSKFLLSKLQSLLQGLMKNKNYYAIETIDLVILSNILKSLFIDITEEEFFFYVSQKIFKKEIKLHLEMLYTIENIENKTDYLFNVFEYFQFFINYKDFLSLNKHENKNIENSFYLLFSDKVEIKRQFSEFYTKLFLKVILNCTENKERVIEGSNINFRDSTEEEIIDIKNEVIIKDKGICKRSY
jgi:hypothetical protein